MNADLYKKVSKLGTKAELKVKQEKTIKLKAFGSSYFWGKNHFEGDVTQNYLILQLVYKYFKNIGNYGYISLWKSKGLFGETIEPPTTYNNSLAPALIYIGNTTSVKFEGDCLKQNKITFTHRKAVNIYIVNEIKLLNYVDSSVPTPGNYLFDAVKLVKILILTSGSILNMVLDLM